MPHDLDVKRFGEHRNAFGFLRLLFAMLVIVAHTPELADGDNRREMLVRLFGTITFGTLAVYGFFLISGYLIVGSFLKNPSAWPYLKKRVARIYPAFIVVSILCVLIVAPLAGATGEAMIRSVPVSLRKVLTLQQPVVEGTFAGTPEPFLNGSNWTIPIEFRCYILVLVLGLAGAFRHRWLILSLSVAALGTFELVPTWVWRTYGDPIPFSFTWLGKIDDALRLGGIFLSGACFRLWRDRICFTMAGTPVCAIGLLVCMFHPKLVEPAIATFGAYLLFGFAQWGSRGLLSSINNRDDISYGVYLYPWPIEKLLLWHWPAALLFPLGLAKAGGAALCGWLSWHLVEKPVMQRLR